MLCNARIVFLLQQIVNTVSTKFLLVFKLQISAILSKRSDSLSCIRSIEVFRCHSSGFEARSRTSTCSHCSFVINMAEPQVFQQIIDYKVAL